MLNCLSLPSRNETEGTPGAGGGGGRSARGGGNNQTMY